MRVTEGRRKEGNPVDRLRWSMARAEMLTGIALLVTICAAPAAAMGAAENQATIDGLTAYRDGRYSVAVSKLKEASSEEPGNAKVKVYLALAQAAMGDCKVAGGELNRAAGDAGDATLARLAGLAAAKCETNAGDTPAALALLTAMEKRYPKDPDVLYAIAKLHMNAFNNATLEMFQRTPASYRVHELSAEIFEVENRYADAAAEYRKAIALNPQAPDLHFRLGRSLILATHDAAAFDAAKTEFQAELRLNPEDAASEFQLGQIAQAQSQVEDARRHFSRSLELLPDFADALIALGKIESKAKEFKPAITHLERAAALQPTNENAHYALMIAYRDSGQIAKAKAEKATLDRLQRPAEGEFTEFLKKLGEKPPEQ